MFMYVCVYVYTYIMTQQEENYVWLPGTGDLARKQRLMKMESGSWKRNYSNYSAKPA